MPVPKRLTLGTGALLVGLGLAFGFTASTEAQAAPRPQVWNAGEALSGQGPTGSVVFGDSIVVVEQVQSPATPAAHVTPVRHPVTRPGGRAGCANRPARRPVPPHRARHHIAKRHHHTGRQHLIRRHHIARHHVIHHHRSARHHVIQGQAHRV